MKTNIEQLSSITKTAQMGQIGILCVLDRAQNQDLKNALNSQLNEYDMIEAEAKKLANQKGWEIEEINPGVKSMSKAYTKACLMMGNADSRIAAMMINGNTRGMIKSIKNQHHAKEHDSQVDALAEKLLLNETNNIKQMQAFL